ncbi:alpha-amylase family glycosyl hydrolase [Haliangium sp.]|uniref:alpha-amylase family glycosyl hydrolase n=1 Tax=Haliangium sp. TaxID=2663208 RepID=UPI003D0CFC9A
MAQRNLSKRLINIVAALAAAGVAGGGCVAEDLPDEQPAPSESTKARNASDRTLGAFYAANGSSVTFRVYSSRATRMEVHIFAEAYGQDEVASFAMSKNGSTNVWSATVSAGALAPLDISDHVYYGYRAWGPNWPYNSAWTKGSEVGFITDVDSQGNRFNPNKLLSDPYALEISHDPATVLSPNDSIYASGPDFRAIDNGAEATKSVAFPEDNTSIGSKPTRAFKDDIVYEVHVRGLTMQDSSIPSQYRGTYKGAGLKAAALADLGVTAVEFLPVHETLNDVNDVTENSTAGDNYWGYMTINFFAPDRRYAYDQGPGGPTREFKEMVRAFHAQGIKVYVDVVYNHTAEGGPFSASDPRTAKLFNYRGLDNPTYYSLTSDRQFNYDNTGVGGNYNTFNPIAQNLIIDSLLYWRDEMGLDGYRFDLASVLGNTCEHACYNYDKLNPGTALNRIWRDLSPRPAGGGQGVDLIAEPWAIGGNSYQVGNFPSGWIEWGASFRDSLRKDQNRLGVDAVTPGELATRFAGSSDKFGDDGRRPWNSVNFMVAHDGMTLRDLYACNEKNNNQPWPFGPSDGGEDHNNSWDQGGNAAQQRRAARNGMTALMISAGVPMITGGDEFLRSQACNNNAYNLDSEVNWLDYALNGDEQNFRTFSKRLMAFRKAHPALRPNDFYSAVDNNGNILEQLRWFKPDGSQADGAYFSNASNHALAWRVDGSELGDSAKAIYIAYNGWEGYVDFTLPWTGPNASAWYRVTDTCDWAEGPDQVRAPGQEDFIGGEGTTYGLCDRGILILVAK